MAIAGDFTELSRDTDSHDHLTTGAQPDWRSGALARPKSGFGVTCARLCLLNTIQTSASKSHPKY